MLRSQLGCKVMNVAIAIAGKAMTKINKLGRNQRLVWGVVLNLKKKNSTANKNKGNRAPFSLLKIASGVHKNIELRTSNEPLSPANSLVRPSVYSIKPLKTNNAERLVMR